MFPVLSLAQIAQYMFMLEPITGSRVELLLASISAQEKKEIQVAGNEAITRAEWAMESGKWSRDPLLQETTIASIPGEQKVGRAV